MKTTIQISDRTRRMLAKLKHALGEASYESTLARLLREKLGIPGKIFGAYPDIPEWSEMRERDDATGETSP